MKQIKKLSVIFLSIFLIFSFVPFLSSNTLLADEEVEFDDDYVEGELIVKYKGDSEPFRVVKLSPGKPVREAEFEFEEREDVEYAEPNYIAQAFMVPNDPYYHLQWHFDNPTYGGIQTQSAWDISSGSGVTVAVVDTGIAYENYKNALNGQKYYKAPDLASTCFVSGYDFVENDTHSNDDNSHGTHVAGTIAQSTNNSTGVAGVAFKSCLMPVKVLDRNGSGTYVNVAKGIRFAADNGAKVINLSLGGSASSQTLLDAVAYANLKGVVVVAAAGNNGINSISYPAAYDDYVIAVGATRYDESRTSYSNYGASLDLVAPGGDLTVDQNNDGYGDGVLQNTFDPNTKKTSSFGYWFFQGTSMAAPHVAGVAALVISKGSAVTSNDVRKALESTTEDLGVPGKDDKYGWGLVNAAQAVNWRPGPVDNPPGVTITNPLQGSVVKGTISITASASDDKGVTKVDFFIDNILIGSDTMTPYEVPWNSTTVIDGSHVIKAVAFDTASQSSTHSISVLVDNVNDPPIANAGPDIIVIDNDGNGFEAVTLDGSKSFDPDGTIVVYQWKEGAALLGNVAIITVNFAVGSHTVTLTVTDNGGATGSDAVVVTVNPKPAGPQAPQNLQAIGGEEMVKLTWVANTESDLAGYRIFRSTTTGGPYSQIGEVGKITSFTDSDIEGIFYYRIKAFNTSGKESPFSNEASALAQAASD